MQSGKEEPEDMARLRHGRLAEESRKCIKIGLEILVPTGKVSSFLTGDERTDPFWNYLWGPQHLWQASSDTPLLRVQQVPKEILSVLSFVFQSFSFFPLVCHCHFRLTAMSDEGPVPD